VLLLCRVLAGRLEALAGRLSMAAPSGAAR